MVIERFVHPYTKRFLEKDAEGNLFSQVNNTRDVFRGHDGCIDFSTANPQIGETRDVYNTHYAQGKLIKLSTLDITEPWFDVTVPWRKTMLQQLGSLSGRKILLLGNGASYRELYFLTLGAKIVFTDLSLVAAKRAKAVFISSEFNHKYQDDIEFHAIDAMHLPFPEETFDIIYGSKFVGFLNSLPDFFSEVKRCLKPGGICRFEDDAYSPAWNALREILVVPIKNCIWERMSSLNQIRSGSPHNYFGFKEEQYDRFCKDFGFSRMIFIREYFFLRIAQLLWGKVVKWDPDRLVYAKPVYLTMKWIDEKIARTKWMRKNGMALTMGFDK